MATPVSYDHGYDLCENRNRCAEIEWVLRSADKGESGCETFNVAPNIIVVLKKKRKIFPSLGLRGYA